MYERAYGSKYAEGRDKDAAGIAKLIRRDIRQAQSKGALPEDLEASVTVENFSGGCSIDIVARYRPEYREMCDGTMREYGDDIVVSEHGCPNRSYGQDHQEHETLSFLGQQIVRRLKAIHWAYNHDGSETQTDYHDVNYYGGVRVEDRSSAQYHAKERSRLALRRTEADERRKLIAGLADGFLYKAGNLRHWSTERLREAQAGRKAESA